MGRKLQEPCKDSCMTRENSLKLLCKWNAKSTPERCSLHCRMCISKEVPTKANRFILKYRVNEL